MWELLRDSAVGTVATAVGTVAAIVSVIVALVPRRPKPRRVFKDTITAKLFGQDTIDKATRYYVDPACASVDPTHEAEIRHVVVAREPLFDAVERYLRQEAPHRHLLVLADSGMGKTSFALNYYGWNQRLPRRRRQRLVVIPLSVPEADTAIEEIEAQEETVLFLDAFDEDTKAIQDHRARLLELMQMCRAFKRVLITCRTQFFPTDEEVPQDTGIVRVGPRRAGEAGQYEFWKLYLLPFDDQQVAYYLRKRFAWWQRKQRRKGQAMVKQIPLLSVRPMLLDAIPDLVEKDIRITHTYELYAILVGLWLERERHWVNNQEALRAFSEQLAVDLYTHRQERGAEHIPHGDLEPLARTWGIQLEGWQLRGRSLLNRNAVGQYKFAHRSIMEYLFVTRLMSGDAACRGTALTDQMQMFLREMLRQREYENPTQAVNLQGVVLSGVALQGFNLAGANLRNADLQGADLRGVDLQGADLEGADLRNLPENVAEFLSHARTLYEARLDPPIRGYIQSTSPLLLQKTFVNSLGMVFVRIDSGEFHMGSKAGSEHEQPEHLVRITQPFYLGVYPVTQGQWETVMGKNPSHFTGDANRPVERVSWDDAQEFMQRLMAKEPGQTYRLPTEAEWEYAARAGTTTAYYFGDDPKQLDQYAWYADNAHNTTHSVGQLKPNAWGLYDMLGNVWEWVHDWYEPYPDDMVIDPQGPSAGMLRILRGGSAWDDAGDVRCASRFRDDARGADDLIGFRVLVARLPSL